MLKMPMIWCQYNASGSDLQSWHGKMMKSWWKWGKERSQSASKSQRWVWSSESVRATTALQPDMNGVPERGQHSNAQGALWRWNCHSNYLCHFCAWTPRSDKLWQVMTSYDKLIAGFHQRTKFWLHGLQDRLPVSQTLDPLPLFHHLTLSLPSLRNWMLFKWARLSTWLTYHCCWSLSQCSLLSIVKISFRSPSPGRRCLFQRLFFLLVAGLWHEIIWKEAAKHRHSTTFESTEHLRLPPGATACKSQQSNRPEIQ